jgi:hypothetical protein
MPFGMEEFIADARDNDEERSKISSLLITIHHVGSSRVAIDAEHRVG